MNTLSPIQATPVNSRRKPQDDAGAPLRHRSEVRRRGFTQFENIVLDDNGISDPAKLTYLALLDYARQDLECFPGQHALAERRDTSDRTIRTHLAELEAVGLITIVRRGFNMTNLYYIEDVTEVYKTRIPVKSVKDRKKISCPTDRKKTSGHVRKFSSGLDRKKTSYKQEAVLTIRTENKTTTTPARPVHQSMPPASPIRVVVAAPMPTAPDPAPAPVDAVSVDAGEAESNSLILRMEGIGVTFSVAVELALTEPDECRRQLDYLPLRKSTDPAAVFVQSVRGRWTAPKRATPVESPPVREKRQAAKPDSAESLAKAEAEAATKARRSAAEAELTRIMADDPERYAAMRAEASQAHPVRLRSGLIFERAVTEWMIGAVTAAKLFSESP